MTYETYRYIFIAGAVLCGIMLVISILIFIISGIPKIISDLSGATARKAIKGIHEKNAAEKAYGFGGMMPGETISGSTDRMSGTGRISHPKSAVNTFDTQAYFNRTESLDNVSAVTDQTTVLHTTSETTVLNKDKETAVFPSTNETTVLDQSNAGQTGKLTADDGKAPIYGIGVEVEYEITYIHTDEVIV